MRIGQIKSAAHKASFDRYVEVRLFRNDANGDISAAAPLVFNHIGESEMYSEPTVRLSRDEAQELIDALWDCGLRPTEGSGSAGALAATQNHLKDLQRIVFKDFQK